MILSALSKDCLLERFAKLVRTERKITHLVLECIAEIDRRQLHLEMAYPSLFEYLTQAHGYSAGAAQRRISAARLLREVPEVASKIEEGTLTLSQIAIASQSIKAAEKKHSVKMEAEDKLDLIEKIESRSFAETQQILAEELKIEAPTQEKVQHHADGSVTITMTLTKDQYQDWCRAGELASHSVPNRKHSELAQYLARKEIIRRTEIRRASPQRQKPSSNPRQIAPNLRKRILGGGILKERQTLSDVQKSTPPKANAEGTRPRRNPTSKNRPPATRHRFSVSEVDPGSEFTSDSETPPACSYTDPRTGKRCSSRHLLQIDHVRPVHTGGSNAPSNLRALCAAHNRWRNMGSFR